MTSVDSSSTDALRDRYLLERELGRGYDRGANHANWDMTADGRMVLVEPLGGGRLLVVTDWSPPFYGPQ